MRVLEEIVAFEMQGRNGVLSTRLDRNEKVRPRLLFESRNTGFCIKKTSSAQTQFDLPSNAIGILQNLSRLMGDIDRDIDGVAAVEHPLRVVVFPACFDLKDIKPRVGICG